MRVALVAQPYVPVPPVGYGGIEKVIYYLIRGLMEQGHEPILVGTGDSNVHCELIPTTAKSILLDNSNDSLRSPHHITDLNFKLSTKR